MSRRDKNIFKRKDGRWEGRYISKRDGKGKAVYRSVYAHSYAECKSKLAIANIPIAKTDILIIEDLFLQWMESKRYSVKQTTYVHYWNLYNQYLKQKLGNLSIYRVDENCLRTLITEMLESGLSPNTVQSVLTMLKGFFRYGKDRYGIENLTERITCPKAEIHEINTFTKSEIKMIYLNSITGNCYQLGILLCLYTGLRIGEICALQWNDIDIENMLIKVNKTIQRIKNIDKSDSKTIIIIDKPKSKNSIRVIPFPPFMKEILNKYKMLCQKNDYFLTCSISYIEPRTYSNKYKSFLKSIGIEYRNFHVLRHTFATECIYSGIDIKTVSELLGHSNVKITLDRYVHSSLENKREQLQKLYSF